MIVLGIDPGTSCGWALRWGDGSYHSGVWTLAIRPHVGAGMRWTTQEEACTAYEVAKNQLQEKVGYIDRVRKFVRRSEFPD